MRRFFVWLMLWPLGVVADEGTTFPQAITYREQTLELVGAASLGFLWYEAYDVALWAPKGNYRASQIHALELVYEMDFSKEELVDESIEQLRKLGDFSESQLRRWRQVLYQLNLSVQEGDRVRIITDPGVYAAFYKNNKLAGKITENELSRNYSQIWLSDDSDYPEVTRQLKGQASP